MSSFVDSLGKFDPNAYKNNGTGDKPKQRMAGDYLTDFANNSGSNISKVLGFEDNNNTPTATNRSSSSSNSSGQVKASAPSNSNSSSQETNSSINYGKYDPNLGNNKNVDNNYASNQKTISSYNGKNASNSTANGAAYNADVMSGIAYNKAVKDNKKYDAIKSTQKSIAAGNDHGIHKGNLAPKSKDYYAYLDTYSGPKSHDEVLSQYKQNTAGMTSAEKSARDKELGQKGERGYDIYERYNKDKMDYEAAWGSGKSVSEQKGWSTYKG